MKLFLRIPVALSFFAFLFVSNHCFGQITCIDSALQFNGINQYVKLAPNEFSGNNFLTKLDSDYTIECLVKWNGGADFQRIFDFSYNDIFFMFLTTSANNTNNAPRFAISTTGLTTPQVLDANISLLPGIYHHIAVTYSKANSLATMFIDGLNAGSTTVNIDADSVYYGYDSHDSSANYIGLSPFAGDPQFDGNIDEFRISDTVRYASDFLPSAPFTSDNHTIALYHFDEGLGQMAADSSGNNYTAQLGSTIDADANDPLRVSCGNVLANSFISFTATPLKEQVQLNWSVPSNANTRYYEIQHSTDAVHFTVINKIVSTGTNENYSYTDLHAAQGNNYYRLKQVDVNGKYLYSKIVSVNINGSGAFKIYPTIAASTIHVSVSQTPSTIIIFNITGKAVKTVSLNNTEQDINISNLPAGNYIIRNTTTNSSLKFVKQ